MGTTESCSDGNNLAIRWEGNRAVTCTTNFAILDKKSTTDRYIANEDGYKHLKYLLFHFYNKCLGGVDLFNQCLANYRCKIHSLKKWWWHVFQSGVDAAQTKAWRMPQRSEKKLPVTFHKNKVFRHVETYFVQGNQVRTDQNKPLFVCLFVLFVSF